MWLCVSCSRVWQYLPETSCSWSGYRHRRSHTSIFKCLRNWILRKNLGCKQCHFTKMLKLLKHKGPLNIYIGPLMVTSTVESNGGIVRFSKVITHGVYSSSGVLMSSLVKFMSCQLFDLWLIFCAAFKQWKSMSYCVKTEPVTHNESGDKKFNSQRFRVSVKQWTPGPKQNNKTQPRFIWVRLFDYKSKQIVVSAASAPTWKRRRQWVMQTIRPSLALL